ncbi:MAG: DUF72 domain-containing protein [Limisphaerales bacterium]
MSEIRQTGLGLPEEVAPGAFNRSRLAESLAGLASRGVLLGTSSWKYPGWIGALYDRDRYVYRGRFSNRRFEERCLADYARVFPTVCVDAAYYQFPTAAWLRQLVEAVPAEFHFAFKVTDAITVKRFPNLPRFGRRAGELNEHFLDADRFQSAFLEVCEPVRDRVGLLIFEFSRFAPVDFARGRDFAEALDAFFARLPRGWSYGVEIRNPGFLHPDYFAVLARHGVTQVFNSWEAMPSLGEQLALPGSRTSTVVAARLLLRPGRRYEEAVSQFQPYDRIRDPYPEGCAAAAALITEILRGGQGRKLLIFVNNRFEGSALQTIENLVGLLRRPPANVVD